MNKFSLKLKQLKGILSISRISNLPNSQFHGKDIFVNFLNRDSFCICCYLLKWFPNLELFNLFGL